MTTRGLSSLRRNKFLFGLVGSLSLTAASSCAPVCRWVDGACLDLRVEGAGSYANYSIEWRYKITDEPLAALRRGATETGGELPRTFLVAPPSGLSASAVTSIGVLALSDDGREQASGSIEVAFDGDEHQTKVLPLGLRVFRTDIQLGSTGSDIVATDLNGDGITDLGVVGMTPDATVGAASGGLLSVLYGTGDGSFGKPQTADIPTQSLSLKATEFTGDSRPELIATGVGENFSLVPNTGSFPSGGVTQISNATGQVAGNCVSGADPHSLAIADFNGDGFIDIAATLRTRPCVTLLLGTSAAGFVANQGPTRPPPTQVGDALSRMAVADFNQDGKVDLAVIRTAPGAGNIDILLGGEQNNGFSIHSVFTAGNEPTDIVTADFNNDQRPDLAVVSARSSSLQIFYNKGFASGMFGGSMTTVVSRPPDYEYRFGLPGYGPTCLAIGDITGDGVRDLAICDGALPSISVMVGRNSGGFDPPIRLAVDRAPSAIAIADLDGKGQRDLAVVHAGSSKLSILLNRTN